MTQRVERHLTQATSDWGAVRKWLGILAAELADRMVSDAAAHHRHPRNLVLHYRCAPAPPIPFPHHTSRATPAPLLSLAWMDPHN